MVTRRRASQPAVPNQPVLARPRAEIEQRLKERIQAGIDMQNKPRNHENDLAEYIVQSGKWRDYNAELFKRFFRDDSLYREYDTSTSGSYVDGFSSQVFMQIPLISASVGQQIATLESILERLEILEEMPINQPEADAVRDLSKVFVVHGHDDAALQGVARFLERIELTAIILREQPDQGRTIIEKFEACAKEVGFAVVLLTPDDLMEASATTNRNTSRARQNVIFELGYFAGKLGRGRACLLRKGEVEIPSDLYGVIYTELDAADGWKLKLAKELKAAGLKFDSDKVF
jgi:predicted nucleotide-binding protein